MRRLALLALFLAARAAGASPYSQFFWVRGDAPGHVSYQVQWGSAGGSGGSTFIPVGTKLAFLGQVPDVLPGSSFAPAVQVAVEDPQGTIESYAFQSTHSLVAIERRRHADPAAEQLCQQWSDPVRAARHRQAGHLSIGGDGGGKLFDARAQPRGRW